MISLWDLGITNELFSLIFKLNETTDINVNTPFGVTNTFTCNRIVKQGSVLGSNICSASTAEVCNTNMKGSATVGDIVINDILYVDDTTDLNSDINQAIESHYEVQNFCKMKRMNMNYSKCGIMGINLKTHDSLPSLLIEENKVPHITESKIVGDVVNNKGTNMDLMEHKLKQGNAALISCMARCNESTMGVHSIKSAMTLYDSVFIAVLLFNSHSWTNITAENLKKLETLQLKYLKRVLRSAPSTPNLFLFLEFGVLPISYLIHIRQLCFLHHITHIGDDHPVHLMYHKQITFLFEKNWGNKTKSLLSLYHLNPTEAQSMSKEAWKNLVKKNVSEHAFKELQDRAKEFSKIKNLQYTQLSEQPYLTAYQPKIASTIAKLRSRSVDCKNNRKSSQTDLSCRLCGKEEETQQHMVNCSHVSQGPPLRLDDTIMDVQLNNENVLEVCKRVGYFFQLEGDNRTKEVLAETECEKDVI